MPTGIHLDAGSEDNVFTASALNGNGANLLDEGSGNCGLGNSPEILGLCS